MAVHRSGRIVIEVSDDGAGIDRVRVRQIAEKKGLVSPEDSLSEDEIDNLIFLPGFSTAESVSNISGRGVGMDVVKRSIQALGGRISITSQPGRGSVFSLSLPLTLAVLDGMVVCAGDQTLITPLTSVVETLRPKPHEVRALGPHRFVVAVRDSHVPLIDVGVLLGARDRPLDPANGVCLLVESEVGGRAALLVDSIQGQRQVVIKSLEANYQKVDLIAAATILGDGRVALILDVDAVIETGRRDAPRAGGPIPFSLAS
jgi:two-component system chemotaxis sensor kinase CheA